MKNDLGTDSLLKIQKRIVRTIKKYPKWEGKKIEGDQILQQHLNEAKIKSKIKEYKVDLFD